MQGPDPRYRFPNSNMPRFPGPNMMPHGSGMGCFRPGGPPRPNFNQPPPFNPRLGESGPRFNTPFRPNGPHTQRMPTPHLGPSQTQMPISNGHPGPQRPQQFGPQRPQRPPGQFQNQRPHSPFHNGPRAQWQGNGFQAARFSKPNFDGTHAPGHFQQRPQFKNGNRNVPEKKKQPKMDKRDKPENNRFYCDVCDRGYKDEDKYQAHIDSHEKCPKSGCPYVAVSKLVHLHLRLQHGAGFAKKIWAADSPEDIKKWREERKRNYPTAENISKKKEQLEQKRARGELIEEKYFGKMRHGGRGGQQGRGRGRGQIQGHDQNQPKGQKDKNDLKRQKSDDCDKDDCSAEKKQKTDSEKFIDELKDSLSVFFGNADTDTESDEESVPEETSSKVSKPTTAAGALGSLISAYNESDEEREINEDDKSGNKKDNDTKTGNIKLGKGGKVEQNDTKRKKNRRKKTAKNTYRPKPIHVGKSLLEKLLAKEIRQERNKILQCVYYIVNHGFFDVK